LLAAAFSVAALVVAVAGGAAVLGGWLVGWLLPRSHGFAAALAVAALVANVVAAVAAVAAVPFVGNDSVAASILGTSAGGGGKQNQCLGLNSDKLGP
jgi:hypothetical protein